MIKCDGKLKLNEQIRQAAKEQNNPYPIYPYLAAVNENSFEAGMIYNINVMDMSSQYEKVIKSQYNYVTSQYLNSYAQNLETNGINYKKTEFNGLKALEYSFSQQDLPTMAILFVKDKQSYMLQVATRTNLTKKFNSLKSSFKFLN